MLSDLVLLLLELDTFFLLVVACAVLIRQELLGVLGHIVFFFTALIMVLKGVLPIRKHIRVRMRVHGGWFL